MNIGQQIGYWKELDEYRQDKARKVTTYINRARACRTFSGLQVVGDEARAEGLWHPVRTVFGQCNARLRGRHVPAIYRKGDKQLVVDDNVVVSMPWISARTLCGEGFTYAGPVE